MKKFPLILLFTALACLPGLSQKHAGSFAVLSYNVENFFDTVNDPDFDDDAFTPEGEKEWTADRYEKKVKDLARVIASVPGGSLPAVIGLAEVENRTVLEDLAGSATLSKGKYRIIHEDSDDPRGIDCALLYRPGLFRYSGHHFIEVVDPSDPEYRLRDILHVYGTAPDGQTLHIFMNHWKSRSGGQKETESKRMHAAIALRKELDRLRSEETDPPRLIIMGDFNDEPTNQSIFAGLSASGKRKNISASDLYNLCYDMHNLQDLGTYAFRGNWNMLDQIIVSHNLLNREDGLSTTFDGAKIIKEDWMLYENERYGMMLPSSTYGGPRYYGGPADHLPVYAVFTADMNSGE